MKTALSDAAKRSSVSGARRVADAIKNNPIRGMFGRHTFELPARGSKEYPADKRNPSDDHTNSTQAQIIIPLLNNGEPSGLVLEARVYRDRQIRKTADGRRAQDTYSVSIPRGIRAAAALTQQQIDAYTEELLDKYFDWRKTLDESSIVKVSAKRGRTMSVDLTD